MITDYIKGRKQILYDKTDKEILNDKKSGFFVIVYGLFGIVLIGWGMNLLNIPKVLIAIIVSLLFIIYVPVCTYVTLLFVENKRRKSTM